MFYKENHIIATIKIKYYLDFAPNYVFVLDDKCFNRKTGRFVKVVENNGSYGYVINGKFKSNKKLTEHKKKIN